MGNFSRSNGSRRGQVFVNPTLSVQVDDVVATATSGTYAGKCGPFDLSATDGRQTLANIQGVACQRASATDGTGIQERVFPNQESDRIAVYIFVPGADANNGFIRDGTGTRISLNAEAGQTTRNYMATHGFIFENFISD